MEQISDKLYEFLGTLPQHIQLQVMLRAMDILSYHNGQTHTRCIMEAMGVEAQTTDEGRDFYAYPDREDVIEEFM